MTWKDPTTVVPTAALLTSWLEYPWDAGVNLARLNPLDTVVVRTRNSTYEIIVTAPSTGEVLVRGGEFFPAFTAARLAGSTLGGSVLKLRSIHRGFRIEFGLGRQFVLTSPVQTVVVRPDVTVAG